MTDPAKQPAQTEIGEQLAANTASFFADLEAVRLSVEDMSHSTRPILTDVPVHKPGPKIFFRCCPDERMSLAVSIYVDPENDGEVYFVAPEMRSALAGDYKAVLLRLSITRKGTLFIWPLTIPNEDNKLGRRWHESAFKAAQIAQSAASICAARLMLMPRT
jgi:hypothetical protein